MELAIFVVSAAIVLTGAVGVVASRNSVHAALSLVMTLFGIAVLFVAQEAHFLAAVQVIVYAGAIVVLFLFVIMLLGVDQADDLRTDPLGGQRPAAAIAGFGLLGVALAAMLITRNDVDRIVTGVPGSGLATGEENLPSLARELFTTHLFAFEATSVLLVIAVVAAVVLARRATHKSTAGDDAEVGS
jgi:NADH-quinone oxidoreductase subunit J